MIFNNMSECITNRGNKFVFEVNINLETLMIKGLYINTFI